VRSIAGQIVKNGKVVNSQRAYLGVTIGETGNGVYVGGVAGGGPAARAGIRAGDVITSVAGKPTPTSSELGTVLSTLKPGQTVKVRVLRQDGSSATVDVEVGEYPGS
jgi:putative serine protease PepD